MINWILRRKLMNKKRGYIANFIFVIKHANETGRNILPIFILLIPLGVAVPTIGAYIPKILLDIIEKQTLPQNLILTVCYLTVVIIGISLLNNHLSLLSDVNSKKLSRRFDCVFSEKVMSMNYEDIEGPKGRNAYQKAKNSLGHYGAYSYMKYLFDFFKNLVGIVVYCIIISKINILIVPAIIGVELFGGIFAMFIRQFENKLKKPKAVIDRKLNYITNTSKNFSAAKDIRVYKMKDFFIDAAMNYMAEKKRLIKKGQKYYAENDIFASLLSLIITGGSYAYLIYTLFHSDTSAGDVVLYIGIIVGFASWLDGAVDSIDSLLRANHAITDVREFLSISTDTDNDRRIAVSKNDYTEWEIEFINVSYKYAGSDTYALKNINLKINAKERLAILGYNGAGKTTLVKLMCGLYKASEGEIKLNDININSFYKNHYFTLFSLVFQDVRVLPESILSNITMKSKNQSNVVKAKESAESADLSNKINNLENGYDTVLMKSVNESATELSGGEAQKLVMSRALYKDAPFVILDEPTAALDPIAENEI